MNLSINISRNPLIFFGGEQKLFNSCQKKRKKRSFNTMNLHMPLPFSPLHIYTLCVYKDDDRYELSCLRLSGPIVLPWVAQTSMLTFCGGISPHSPCEFFWCGGRGSLYVTTISPQQLGMLIRQGPLPKYWLKASCLLKCIFLCLFYLGMSIIL